MGAWPAIMNVSEKDRWLDWRELVGIRREGINLQSWWDRTANERSFAHLQRERKGSRERKDAASERHSSGGRIVTRVHRLGEQSVRLHFSRLEIQIKGTTLVFTVFNVKSRSYRWYCSHAPVANRRFLSLDCSIAGTKVSDLAFASL